MSLRLRFIFEWVVSFFRHQRSENKEYSVTYRVWPNEAEFRVLDNARYAYFFMLGRVNLFCRTNLAKTMRRKGWDMVVGCQIFKIKRPLKRFMKFEVKTHPFTWDDKWFYFEHEIWSHDKLISSAVVSTIFLGKSGKIKPETVLAESGFPTTDSAPLPDKVQSFIETQNLL